MFEGINLTIDNNKIGNKHIKDITNLLSSIKNKDCVMPSDKDEYKRIFKLLVNNKTYIDIAENMDEKVIIEPQYNGATSFSNDVTGVCNDEKWTFINEKDRIVSDYRFLYIG